MDFFKTLFTKKEVKVCLKFLLEYVQSIQNLDIKRKDPVWFNIALEDIKLKTEKSLRDNSVQISESIISKNVDLMTIVLQTFFSLL